MFFNFVQDAQPKPVYSTTPLPTPLSQSSTSSLNTSQPTPTTTTTLSSSFSSVSNTNTIPSTNHTAMLTTPLATTPTTSSFTISSDTLSTSPASTSSMATTAVPSTSTHALSFSNSASSNVTPSLTLVSTSPAPALTNSNPQVGWLHLSPSLSNTLASHSSSPTTTSLSSSSSTYTSVPLASSTSIPSSLSSFPSSSLHMELERIDTLPLPLFKRSTRDVVNTLQKDTELPYLNHSDVVPGEYEGGLKVWECSLDLSNFLISHSLDILTSLQSTSKAPIHLLELGCGTALPTISFLRSLYHHDQLSSIHSVTFHDFNVFVLRHMTYPNVLCNFAPCSLNFPDTSPFLAEFDTSHSDLEKLPCSTHYAFGDWCSLPFLLPKQSYSLIFTSETVYKEEKLDHLIDVLEYALAFHGMAFVAAKTFYFGVGGGLRSLEQRLLDRGSKLISEVLKVIEPTQGSGVPREILKLTWNQEHIPECN